MIVSSKRFELSLGVAHACLPVLMRDSMMAGLPVLLSLGVAHACLPVLMRDWQM